MAVPSLTQPAGGIEVDQPSLKKNAISFISNIVIGVASTAPAYSLASSLGLVAAVVGIYTASSMLIAFVPMLMIAAAYYWMNRADPDCGTTFSWVSKAMGPHLGWLGGWGIFVTDVIVMPSLSYIAGKYTFLLFGVNNPGLLWITVIGVVWIGVMTAICYVGIELSARTQQLLLGAEFVILVVYAVVALVKVYSGGVPHGLGLHPVHPEISWLNPFAVSSGALVNGLLLTVFIYWGWDSGVTVNEETEDSSTAPGRAAIVSNFALLGIFVFIALAAVAFAGPAFLSNNSGDVLGASGQAVLGSPLDKLLIIAVLTSASASTQTTILPTARTVLSMARHGAIPSWFGRIHPRYLSPSVATVMMGAVSTVWYVGMTLISKNVLNDSISALGLGICFYYGITGFACTIFFRRELLKSLRNLIFIGLGPTLGGLALAYVFVKSSIEAAAPSYGSTVIFGVGGVLVIGVGTLLVGIPIMLLCQYKLPSGFFRRRPEVADPLLVASSPAGASS